MRQRLQDVFRSLGPLDVLPAAVLGALSLVELIGPQLAEPGYPGPFGGEIVAIALLVLALLIRRRAPLAAVAVLLGSAALQLILRGAQGDIQVSFETFLAMLIVVFSVGMHAERARGLQALIGIYLYWLAALAVVGPSEHASDDIGLFFVLALSWAVGDAMRRREQRLAAVEDEAEAALAAERARLSHELHDVLAHGLSVMVIETTAARQVLEDNPAAARTALCAAERTGREALGELRRLVGFLRLGEPTRDPPAGLAAVPTLVERFREAGLSVDLELDPPSASLGPGVELAGYRVIQEGLTNVAKHAAGATATVRVRVASGELRIEVCDDGGRAANPLNGTGGGHGLVGLRERLRLYGGTLEAGRDSTGFVLTARLPIEEQ